MRAVNLLPADRGSTRRTTGLDPKRKNLLIGSGIVGVLIVTGLSVMVWSSSSSLNDKQKKLDALRSQIASTTTIATAQTALGTRKATVTTLVANRLAWDQFLGTLSKVMPEDVWLQNLQSTTPGAAASIAAQQAAAAAATSAAAAAKKSSSSTTPTPPPPPVTVPASTFTISGYTYSQPSVARMMRRLDIVPWLSGVSLVSSTKASVGAVTVFQFTVKATVVSTPSIP